MGTQRSIDLRIRLGWHVLAAFVRCSVFIRETASRIAVITLAWGATTAKHRSGTARPERVAWPSMLAITQTAVENITALLGSHQLPEGSGLRIATVTVPEQNQAALEVSVVPQPTAGDTIVQRDKAVVFLEPMAAQALDEMVLDIQHLAKTNGQQQYRFTITPQADSGPNETPSA